MFIKVRNMIAIASMIGTIFALTGCETEPSDQIAISVSPNAANVRRGQSQEFSVSGWQDYTWEIYEERGDNVGVLSTRKGERTVYTAVSGTNDVVVLRAYANVSTAITNRDDEGQERSRVFAEAIISHRP